MRTSWSGSGPGSTTCTMGRTPGGCSSHPMPWMAPSSRMRPDRSGRLGTAFGPHGAFRRGAIVFLFAGKFVPKKRPWDFARALVGASSSTRRVWGLMVGDGPLRPALQATATAQGWPLHFAGFLNQTEMPKAYVASDALVLPSDGRETWGLVVNEAMACGLPAIVSDQVGCGPDLVRSSVSGEVFRCGDVDGLAAVLTRLADDPRRLADARGRCAAAGSRLLGGAGCRGHPCRPASHRDTALKTGATSARRC